MCAFSRNVSLAICVALIAGLPSGCGAPVTTCSLTLELVDSATGQPLPAIVQARNERGELIALSELVNRGQGIDNVGPIHDWWVLSKATTVTVPAAPLRFTALAGLETEIADQRIDLAGRSEAKLRIPLVRFHHAREEGHLAGNTHLHLMKLSKREADRYLEQVPLADGLDVVFLSYLERAKSDLEYTSNNYTQHDLDALSSDHVHYGHGEEHRHNFGSHGEGYGHILLLDIPYIIRPVSIGPGLMGTGPDAPPLQVGIDKARQAGGKVVWAHNLYGFEDIPNWITGRVHANNIFDGSERGSYKDTYYRYLNVGLHVPFSTGTDWFIYDFSRVYVQADAQKPITPTDWLDRLAAGRSYITNGPLLEFAVNDQPLGSTLDLAQQAEVSVHGRAIGRLDFKRIELVQNGRVVGSSASRPEGGHFVAELDLSVAVQSPTWLALRTPPPPVADDPELQEPVATNEFGGRLFAHTSPIYVQLAGRGVFDAESARGLLTEMTSDMQKIDEQATFHGSEDRQSVRRVYEEAIAVLKKRLGQ